MKYRIKFDTHGIKQALKIVVGLTAVVVGVSAVAIGIMLVGERSMWGAIGIIGLLMLGTVIAMNVKVTRKQEAYTETYKANWRDRIVASIANFVLSFATKRYRDYVKGSIQYGMMAAAKDAAQAEDLPLEE